MPDRRPEPLSMRASEAALLTLAVFALFHGVRWAAVGLRAWASDGDLDAASIAVGIDPTMAALLPLAAFLPVIFVALRRHHPSAREGLRALARPVSFSTIALAAVAGAALQPPLAELGNAIDSIAGRNVDALLLRQSLLRPAGWIEGVVLVIALVAVASITEEIFFRGAVLDGLRRRYGATAAIVLSSILFAALHPDAGGPSLAGGLVLGLVAARHGSVVPSIALHGAHNALPVLVPESLLAVRGWNTIASDIEHLDTRLLLATSALAALTLAALLARPQKGDGPA